jgi:predicted DNA-binding transcriptional regulator AlpA
MSEEARARRMLNIEQVLAIVPISRTSLFRLERKGAFPASYWPTPNRRVWFEDEIVAWQNALPPNRRIRVSERVKAA